MNYGCGECKGEMHDGKNDYDSDGNGTMSGYWEKYGV